MSSVFFSYFAAWLLVVMSFCCFGVFGCVVVRLICRVVASWCRCVVVLMASRFVVLLLCRVFVMGFRCFVVCGCVKFVILVC